MFLAIVFIVLGLFLLLNALGIIISTNFWGLFWAIVFLAIGLRLLSKRGRCPICTGSWCNGKIHEKIHGTQSEPCCGGHHNHDEEEHNHQ